MKIIKTNSQSLRKEHPGGFWGRVMPVVDNGEFFVFQHIPGRPRNEAKVTFATGTLNKARVSQVRSLYRQRYGVDLSVLRTESGDLCFVNKEKQLKLW